MVRRKPEVRFLSMAPNNMEDDLTRDVSLVLKTSGASDGQGFDCTLPPPIDLLDRGRR